MNWKFCLPTDERIRRQEAGGKTPVARRHERRIADAALLAANGRWPTDNAERAVQVRSPRTRERAGCGITRGRWRRNLSKFRYCQYSSVKRSGFLLSRGRKQPEEVIRQPRVQSGSPQASGRWAPLAVRVSCPGELPGASFPRRLTATPWQYKWRFRCATPQTACLFDTRPTLGKRKRGVSRSFGSPPPPSLV